MRAAVLAAPGAMEIHSVPIPLPGPGMIRVRLEGCGVCGSNLPPWEGRPWFSYPFSPGAPGHEGWGVVDEIGDEATAFVPGDRVALLGYNSFAEFDVAPQDHAVRIPPELDHAALPAEALGCAWNVFRRSALQPEMTVAIVGVGFLGAMIAQLAVRAGAKVIAISRRPVALEMAKQFGASAVIPMEDHGRIVGQVRDLTHGAGCDCVIEAVGQQWPLDLASELTRERGRLVIAGYHQDGSRQVNMQLWNWRGLDVINAHERDPKIYVEAMRAAIRAMQEGRFDPSPLFTHCFALDQVSDAFESMRARNGNFMKALVRL